MQINNFAQVSYAPPSFEKLPGHYQIGSYCLRKMGQDINSNTVKHSPSILKMLLRKFTPVRVKEMAQLTLFIANEVKTYFDKLYGEGNYTLISIGRSVSAIIETVQELGADVKILPLSGLRKGLPKEIEDLDIYEEYIKSIKLDEESLNKNPDRKFILMDFEATGNTLESAYTLFQQKLFSEPAKNLQSCSINKVLCKDFQKEVIKDLFCYSSFKLYSPVGQLDIRNLKDCVKQAKTETSKEYESKAALYIRNLFRFNVFDKLNSKSFEYIEPENEYTAVLKRFMAPEIVAIRFGKVIINMNKLLEELNDKNG